MLSLQICTVFHEFSLGYRNKTFEHANKRVVVF